MSNQQISDKTVVLLSVLTLIATLITITYMIVSGDYKTENKQNCWDKYSTEQEAIINCEGEQ